MTYFIVIVNRNKMMMAISHTQHMHIVYLKKNCIKF